MGRSRDPPFGRAWGGAEADSERKVSKMRRKVMWMIGGALALGLVGSLTASAHLDDQQKAGQLGAPETLTLGLGPPSLFKDVDLGKKGQGRGDKVYLRAPLLDDSGEQVGHQQVICEQFTPKPRVFYCQEEDHILGRGTILSAGFQDLAVLPITVLHVIGGTGEFRNASGQVTLDFDAFTVMFDLIP